MESTIILCAFLAANVALCGLAWGQSQGCPCADCSVQRNNLLSERTCSAGDVRFFGTANLITQRPGPQIFAQQNATYVSTHLTFPCSGYIQRVEIQAKGDESLQNVTLDLHLWRIQNSTNSTLLFQQVKRFTMNFNVTFNSPRYIVLSANISERNQSQFHFYEGDILGFTIPVNSPVNVTSSTPEEPGCPVGKNMTYLLSGNCTPADSSSVCDMPRIGITFGSPSFSAPLLTSSPTPSPSFSVLPSLPSPTSSPAGVSQMTPEPMSPTSSQPTNIIFIILGAVLGSIACTVLITAMIILVIYILQRRTPSTKWTHSSTELNASAPHGTTLEHFAMNTNDAYGTNTTEIATTGNVAYMTSGDTISATQNVAYEQMSDGANARGNDEEQRQIEPQLKDLILVRTVKWYELGLQLEVEGKDLDVIQANNQNNIEACKREMFSKWLGITPNASYQQVVEALQIVGEISEADHLRKKIR